MSEKPTDGSPIMINQVTVKRGNSVDQDIDNLMGCYFEEINGHPNQYHFFSKLDNHIPTAPDILTSGTDFKFIRAGMLWTVTQFTIGLGKASGSWENPRHLKSGDDDGSFQAQSGAGEGSSAASAYV